MNFCLGNMVLFHTINFILSSFHTIDFILSYFICTTVICLLAKFKPNCSTLMIRLRITSDPVRELRKDDLRHIKS